MVPRFRVPTKPGIYIEEELKERGLTQTWLAKKMRVPIQRVNTIIKGKRGVSAETAILLAGALGTTPELFMNLQTAVDLFNAKIRLMGGKIHE